MLTTAGSGYSARPPLAVTRWREDTTRDHWGSFIYLRDVRSGAVWSAGYQPVRRTPQSYEVTFAEDKVDIRRRDAGIVTHTEIIVAPEDDAELRRVSLTNQTSRVREVEVTSYSEVDARAARCRCRAPGVQQSLYRNGISSRRSFAHRAPPPAFGRLTRRCGASIRLRSRVKRSARCSMKPTARVFSGAAMTLPRPPP